jgi:hypothetical protein
MTVDGEVFDIRPNETGTGHHFDWVSGPDPSYGFSTGMPTIFVPVGEDGVARTEADDTFFAQQIREFLAQIDPETGYIGD